jgi:hypothetical protein
LSAIRFNKRTPDRESHFWLASCLAIFALPKTRRFEKICLRDGRVTSAADAADAFYIKK